MSLLKEVEVELPIFLFIKIIKATNILVWVNKSINNKLELVAPDKEKIEEDQISIHLQINNREANIPMDHIVKAETQPHLYLHFWAQAIQVSTIAGIPHQSLIATTLTIKTRQETRIVILAKITAKIKIRAVDCWIILQRYHRVRVLRVPWTKPCPWRDRGHSNLEVLKVVMEVKDRCYLRRECRRRFRKWIMRAKSSFRRLCRGWLLTQWTCQRIMMSHKLFLSNITTRIPNSLGRQA